MNSYMVIRPDIFLTSDTHFGHRRLVDYGRPEDFNERIVENWKKAVRDNNIVLHLGDLSMINKERTIEYTSQLPGIKYLIRGNHDRHSEQWFADVGFIVIPKCYWIYKDKYDVRHNILFTHEPVLNLPDGWFNIHGHTHGNNHRGPTDPAKHIHVGVDDTNWELVRLYDILPKPPITTASGSIDTAWEDSIR